MNTKELKLIIKTAEDLGYDNLGIAINDSRDGAISYINAKANIAKDSNGNVLMVISYE